MIEKLKSLEALIGGGLLSGMILQYIFGIKRGWNVIGVILITTLYLAFYIIWPLMDYINSLVILGEAGRVPADSPIRILVMSLTALISQVLVALIIRLLPKALQEKFKQFTGYKDDE